MALMLAFVGVARAGPCDRLIQDEHGDWIAQQPPPPPAGYTLSCERGQWVAVPMVAYAPPAAPTYVPSATVTYVPVSPPYVVRYDPAPVFVAGVVTGSVAAAVVRPPPSVVYVQRTPPRQWVTFTPVVPARIHRHPRM